MSSILFYAMRPKAACAHKAGTGIGGICQPENPLVGSAHPLTRSETISMGVRRIGAVQVEVLAASASASQGAVPALQRSSNRFARSAPNIRVICGPNAEHVWALLFNVSRDCVRCESAGFGQFVQCPSPALPPDPRTNLGYDSELTTKAKYAL
ncbi:hypothetical protein EVAR_57399_1 [Eumeta japonica]|uniref:Uncharacterized protein n=1 Tax=Eumeta variegata TaxID=151549 RepID=A0A4C1YET8_EUMVA|nr:hypothetical protein EVAR_57399_1 [Eumeta japonica]